MANRIFTSRLEALKAKGDAPFLTASADGGSAYRQLPYASVSAETRAEDWKNALRVLQTELRRIEQHGFLPEEVDAVRKEILRGYELGKSRAANQVSQMLLMRMIARLHANRVYLSPERLHDMMVPMVKAVTADDLHKAFLSMWKSGNHFVAISGNAEIEGDAEAVIAKAWQAGKDVAVAALAPEEKRDYPYLPRPNQTGHPKPMTTRILTDPEENTPLVLHETVFENGLRLRMIPTPFQKGQMEMNLLIANGTDAISDADYDAFLTAANVNALSGFGRLSLKEQHRIFRSTGIYVKTAIGSRHTSLRGGGQSADMETILEAMWTEFRDPAVEPRNREQFLSKLAMADAARGKDVISVLTRRYNAFLSGKSLRTVPFTQARATAISMDRIREILSGTLHTGSGTLLIVGDIDPGRTARLVARFFGSPELSWGKNPEWQYAHQPVFPGTDGNPATLDLSVPATLNQATLMVAYKRPLPDISDRKAINVCHLVADAMQDRLREVVREEMGASYSPSMYFSLDEANGSGLYILSINTQPEKLDDLKDAVGNATADLVRKGVSEEVLDRMRRPLLNAWEQGRRENGIYRTLLRKTTERDLPYFEWNRRYPERMNRITAADLNAELKRTFRAENRASLSVTEAPEAPEAN